MTEPIEPNLTGGDLVELDQMLDENKLRIRALNDDLRTNRNGGIIVITPGIAGLGPSLVNRVLAAVASFDGFNSDNDPLGEHDFALMTVEGITIIWKIDYYDRRRLYHSPDASDPKVTSRVLTVMRGDEY